MSGVAATTLIGNLDGSSDRLSSYHHNVNKTEVIEAEEGLWKDEMMLVCMWSMNKETLHCI